MTRLLRAAIAAIVLAGVLNAGGLAVPGDVFACICVKTEPAKIGTYVDDPDVVVFVGTVVSVSDVDGMGDNGGRVAVTSVYKGVLSADMPITTAGGTCTRSIAAGQRMITAAVTNGAAIHLGACMPHGDPASPEGQRLIAAAEDAYGPGLPPGEVRIAPGDRFGPDPSELGIALLATLVGLAVAALMFGLVIVLSRRGRGSAP
jgi:hypothetical protein